MDVLILAGGKCDDEFRAKTGCEFRSQVPFLGRSMTSIVLDATRDLGRPLVVGPSPEPSVDSLPAGEGFLESLMAGLEKVGPELLMVTADLPLVEPVHMKNFLAAVPKGCDICVPIIEQAECERVAPGVPRTTVALRGGRFTAGNVLWARSEALRHLLPKVRQGYADRKSPLKLAGLLGPSVLARLVLARLSPNAVSPDSLAKAASARLGMDIRAVVIRDAEIGTDVDRYDQYEALVDLKTRPQAAEA